MSSDVILVFNIFDWIWFLLSTLWGKGLIEMMSKPSGGNPTPSTSRQPSFATHLHHQPGVRTTRLLPSALQLNRQSVALRQRWRPYSSKPEDRQRYDISILLNRLFVVTKHDPHLPPSLVSGSLRLSYPGHGHDRPRANSRRIQKPPRR